MSCLKSAIYFEINWILHFIMKQDRVPDTRMKYAWRGSCKLTCIYDYVSLAAVLLGQLLSPTGE